MSRTLEETSTPGSDPGELLAQANPRRLSATTRMPIPAELADVSDSTSPS